MKVSVAGWIIGLSVVALCSFASPAAPAQANTTAEQSRIDAEEKEGCTRNLKVIYDAIQAYKLDHKDLPNWLSDLVPQYIGDASILICPRCKRTGLVEPSALGDPNIPCSYLFEFCPVPLGKNDLPNGPIRSRREWKRRQMGLVGSIVPIVRCRHHTKVLNLAFDGRIYESPPSWEDILTNQVNVADLKPARLFADEANQVPAIKAAPARSYPPRDPQAKPNLINLSAYYNASLDESWHGNANNDLSSLPAGVQVLSDTEYDVRGIVQLSGKPSFSKHFPARVNGIKIQQKCSRLHFLHAAGFGSLADEGQQLGGYVIHFATNQMQLEVPIVYGQDLRDWHKLAGEKPSADLKVAWTGTNAISAAARNSIRLFSTTWVNILPNVEIESVDFVSTTNSAAPFLIAITAE
jgi:hypothetical protein